MTASPDVAAPLRSIGIVGGGQLAWMLAEAAADLGVAVHVQTPSGEDPAVRRATSVVEAGLEDVEATRRLAERCGVVSFENEWIPLADLAVLAAEGVCFLPSLQALTPLVDKRAQRRLLDALQLPSLRWCPLEEVLAAAGALVDSAPATGAPVPPPPAEGPLPEAAAVPAAAVPMGSETGPAAAAAAASSSSSSGVSGTVDAEGNVDAEGTGGADGTDHGRDSSSGDNTRGSDTSHVNHNSAASSSSASAGSASASSGGAGSECGSRASASAGSGSSGNRRGQGRSPAAAAPRLPQGFSFPLIAKAACGGYDGRGIRLLADQAALEALLAEVEPGDWLLEELVRFELELAVVACRDRQGNVLLYPLVQTHQQQQVCDWVLFPAPVDHGVEAFARNVAASLLTALDYVGVLAIEFFYGPGGLQINEIAPRTHNSGHYTIEVCDTSQFAQQVRIVTGLPLGSSEARLPAALMINLLAGSEPLDAAEQAERLQRLREIPQAGLHWYDKRGHRRGRKLGHLTIALQGDTARERQRQAAHWLEQVRQLWPLPEPQPDGSGP